MSKKNRYTENGIYAYNGKEYSTIKQLSIDLNINTSTLAKRLERGWELDVAIETPCISNGSTLLSTNEVEYNGEMYKCLPELCKLLNLDYRFVYKRIVAQGYTIQEAIDTPIEARKGRGFHYNGKHYLSIGQFCRENNLNESSFRYYLRIGLPLEDAAAKCNTIANKRIAKDREIEYNDEQFKTRMDLLKSIQPAISYTTFSTRLADNVPVEDALKPSINFTQPTQITYEGITYESLADLARAYNLKPYQLQDRINYGIPLEMALIKPVKEKPRKTYEYKKKKYNSLAELSRETGINYQTIQMRLHRGMSLEDAIETQSNQIEYSGKTYISLTALANEYGLSQRTLRYRLKVGMSLEDSLQTKYISYEGKNYKTIKEIAQEYGINYRRLRYELSKGMSIKEAVDNLRSGK